MTTTPHIEILAHPKYHSCWINLFAATSVFKRVTYCKVLTTGARNDHSPIQAKFKRTAIKLNIPKEDKIVNDWETIGSDKDYLEVFNDKLHLSLMEHRIYEPTEGQEYTTLNYRILQAASKTATKLKYDNKGWFNHYLVTLLPVITS